MLFYLQIQNFNVFFSHFLFSLAHHLLLVKFKKLHYYAIVTILSRQGTSWGVRRERTRTNDGNLGGVASENLYKVRKLLGID
jgi:hypothetical protein